MDWITILIIIAVACVLFKTVSWFLICRNATDESKRYRARQLVRIGRGSRRSSAVKRGITNLNSVHKARGTVLAAAAVLPPAHDVEAPADPEPEPQTVAESESGPETAEPEPDPKAPEEDTLAANDSADPDSHSLLPNEVPASDIPLQAVVPAVAAGGLVAMTISEDDKSAKAPGTPKSESPPPAKVTPAPDFDDYKSLSPKNVSAFSSPPALPTPQYLDPPPPSPSTSRQITLQRKKMARRLQEQEGMDF